MSDNTLNMSNSRGWIIAGFVVIAALFGGLGSWAYYANITGAVVASGVVGVESKVKEIQHLNGGMVSKIYVKDGDRIKAGDLLLRLDETIIRANLAVTIGQLYEYKAQKHRLIAERDYKSEVSFASELLGDSENDDLQRILQGQRALFEARRAGRSSEVQLLNQQIEQNRQEIKGLETQHASKNDQNDLIKEEIADILPLFEKGLTPKSRLLALKREKVRIEGEIGKFLSDIARTRGAIREIDLKILKTDVDFHEQVLTMLLSVQLKIVELEERRITLQDQYNHIEIRAPQSGRVHNLAVHTIGGIISPGTTILQIVPELDRLIIEARVATTDIDQIHLNQKAKIQFSAFDTRTTPQLTAKVIKVSADRLVDSATGAAYFTVDLALDPGQTELLGNNVLVAGMPAEAFLRTVDRTVLNILLKPLTDQLARAFRAN